MCSNAHENELKDKVANLDMCRRSWYVTITPIYQTGLLCLNVKIHNREISFKCC